MKGPRIGELKNRIKIYKKSLTSSPSGQPIETNELLKSCWANEIEMSGSEEEDGKIRFLLSTAFIVRYDNQLRKGKASEMFVRDSEDNDYDIISVISKIPKRYLQINTVRRE